MTVPAALPVPAAPMIGPGGVVTHTWRYFFQQVLTRAGGASGNDFGAPASVSLTSSPFVFTAPSGGALFLSGGGISALTIARGGVGFPTGSFYGAFPMAQGDTMTIRYVRAPAAVFIPG